LRVAPFVLLAALVLAGCGFDTGGISNGGKVQGRTVTVYSLMPDAVGRNRDFVDGEKLALADAGGKAGSLFVNFNSLELGEEDRDEAETVRRAVTDAQIIAAVVDATPVTVPLLNAAGILQVAPGGDIGLASDPNAQPLGHQTVFPPSGVVPPDFAARFREAYRRAPGAGADDGYRAMNSVLRAITAAGTAGNDRQAVIDAYV
jgi:hypothetical protein